MDLGKFRERAGYALSKGGISATGFWLMRRTMQVSPEIFLETALGPAETVPAGEAHWDFHCLSTPADLAGLAELAPDARRQLDQHSDQDTASLVAEGKYQYLLRSGPRLVCQLNISPGSLVMIDAPLPLGLDIGTSSALLGFLHTCPEFRRRGAARTLIRLAGNDLYSRGFRRLIAQVERTNVPSINTFLGLGWRKAGSMVSTTGKRPRLIWSSLERAGIRLLATPQA